MQLFKRTSSNFPSAFSIQPSPEFLDADGLWSTFKLEVGNEPGHGQNFLVVISTSSYTTWLPNAQSCSTSGAPANCSATRGIGLFNGEQSPGYDDSKSSSSSATGKLGTDKIGIGGFYNAQTLYGQDYDVSGDLGEDELYMSSSTAPSITHNSSNIVPIFAYASGNYYLASLGIGVGVYLSGGGLNMSSAVTSMADAGAIPSLSWGYTAGAYYDNLRLASLVLGGYDQARIQGEPAQFKFFPMGSVGSEILVSVSSIGIQYKNSSTSASTPPPNFDAVIDSTLPYLFLPNTTCDWLAQRLHLQYDDSTDLYTIDPATLESNRANIDTFTIIIGSTRGNSNGPSTISITFPYDAFNANAVWTWGWNSTQAIFPIRRAPSSTAVLGRPFFQEAYVSADYTNMVFNVSQAAPQKDLTNTPNIISIYNATVQAQMDEHSSKLSTGAIAGIAVGGVIVALAIAAFLLWFCWLKDRKKKEPETDKETELRDVKVPFESPDSPRPDTLDRRDTFESMSSSLTEMEGTGVSRRPSIRHTRGTSAISELSSVSDDTSADGTGRTRSRTLDAIHELGMADKSDAAEYERMEAERRAREAATPAELEGEGHLMQPPPAR